MGPRTPLLRDYLLVVGYYDAALSGPTTVTSEVFIDIDIKE